MSPLSLSHRRRSLLSLSLAALCSHSLRLKFLSSSRDSVSDSSRTFALMKFLLSVLAGDFLLSRACVALASLRNTEVVSLLAKVVEHLVTGETMQMTSTSEQRCRDWHISSLTTSLDFTGTTASLGKPSLLDIRHIKLVEVEKFSIQENRTVLES
ncbi:hypothetical protein Scep_027375 [Stephania cephalantha]|uniref:Uncharacterized protein n=1 Tax=Stephania cephalantha TaxID=152367 RepID=A0AAP0EB34_9MAGN